LKYIIEFMITLVVFFYISGFITSNRLFKTKKIFHTIFIEERENGEIRVLVTVLNNWVNPLKRMNGYKLMPFHNYRNIRDAQASAERIKFGMLKDKIYSKTDFEPIIINIPDIRTPHGRTFIENYFNNEMD